MNNNPFFELELMGGTEGKQGLQGEKGEQGIQGEKGETGAVPNLQIGEVESIPVTESPEVTITGTQEEPRINFRLPGQREVYYGELKDIPEINGQKVIGEKSLEDLGIQPKGDYLTYEEVEGKYQPKGNYIETEEDPTVPDYVKGITQEDINKWNQNSGGIGEETDPTVPDYVKSIQQENIDNWNNKSDFSGNYEDLSNKPNIPEPYTLPTASTNILGGIKVGNNLEITPEGVLNALSSGENSPYFKVLEGTEEEPVDLDKIVEKGTYIINGKVTNVRSLNLAAPFIYFIIEESADLGIYYHFAIGKSVTGVSLKYGCRRVEVVEGEMKQPKNFDILDIKETNYDSTGNKGFISNIELQKVLTELISETYDEFGFKLKKLTELATDDKSSLIDAINEVLSKIPTEVSSLNNDSGYITKEEASTTYQARGNYVTTDTLQNYSTKDQNDSMYQPKGDYAHKDDIPTKTSELVNDSNFLTEHQPLGEYLKSADAEKEYAKQSQIPDVSNLVTNEELEKKDYASKSDIPEETDPTVPDYVKNIQQKNIDKWNEIDDIKTMIGNINTELATLTEVSE